MNARLFQPNLPDLPKDIFLQVAGFLTSAELFQLIKVSKQFRQIVTDENILELHEKLYGPISLDDKASNITKKIKAQYHAACLYYKAQNTADPGIKDKLISSLTKFLASYSTEAWAKYYLGLTNYYLSATSLIHMENGLRLLCKSFDDGEYRAALEIMTILLETEHSSLINDILNFDAGAVVGEERCHLFFPHLLTADKFGVKSAARAIASCYRDGIGVKRDPEEAVKWSAKAAKFEVNTEEEKSECLIM